MEKREEHQSNLTIIRKRAIALDLKSIRGFETDVGDFSSRVNGGQSRQKLLSPPPPSLTFLLSFGRHSIIVSSFRFSGYSARNILGSSNNPSVRKRKLICKEMSFILFFAKQIGEMMREANPSLVVSL